MLHNLSSDNLPQYLNQSLLIAEDWGTWYFLTMEPTPFKPLLNPDFIVRTLHLKTSLMPRPRTPFFSIVTDSRKVAPGSLFVALKGENLDGHDFIDQAMSQGARGVLYRRGVSVTATKDSCLFPVDDPLAAYRKIAAAWRREFSIPMIAVVGSVGKTTTKELLAAILQGKWKNILKTQGSQNGFIGIPMTLLELREEHQAAIIEIGIDEIGAMQQHMTLVLPNTAVLTAIGPEHLEKLQDIPTVAREEGRALSYVSKAGGITVINLDDPWIRPHLMTLKEGRKIPFSLNSNTSSIDMISGQLSPDGQSLTFQGLGIPPTLVRLPLLGAHNASNLLAAIAVAAGLGLDANEIQLGLEEFRGADGRSEIRELPGHTTVVCDYYNAQPASMKAGLDLLSQVARNPAKPKNQWACLGDMLELGPEEERFHRELATKIIELKIDNILLYGPRMAFLVDELEKLRYSGQYSHFPSHTALATALTQGVRPGDAILIKGSRGMKMEEIWKVLEPYAKIHWENLSPSSHPSTHV